MYSAAVVISAKPNNEPTQLSEYYYGALDIEGQINEASGPYGNATLLSEYNSVRYHVTISEYNGDVAE